MPENDDQGVSVGTQVLAETDKERFERERLSRRQALRKFGVTAGMATFALFSVDDLARMVGKAMQQRVRDNRVAEQVAEEFQRAGVALASGPSSSCQHCVNQYNSDIDKAYNDWLYCYNNELGTLGPSGAYRNCNNGVYCPEVNGALYAYNCCAQTWCSPSQLAAMGPPPYPAECKWYIWQ